MYNDPNTGQFQWGDVIQDIIRNYMMMQMMKDKQQPPDPMAQAATVGPVGGQGSTMPGIQGPNPHAPGAPGTGSAPGMGAPMPGGPGGMPQLPPGLLQMIMQMLQQSQMGR